MDMDRAQTREIHESEVTFSCFRKRTGDCKRSTLPQEIDTSTAIFGPNKTSSMGEGKRWDSPECRDLATAWISASEENGEASLKGTHQESELFWESVRKHFDDKTPDNCTKGTYKDRGTTAVKNQWCEKVSRDVKKFNEALLKVMNGKPTGVTEEQKINLAVAIHLGKVDTVAHRHKDFDPREWKQCLAWQVLKDHRAYLPPTAQTEETTVELDLDADDELELPVAGSSSDTGNDTDVPASAVKHRRIPKEMAGGPGPGAKKTKAKAKDDDCRKKKTKIQEQLLEAQKQRQVEFASCVQNQARAQAFKMAVMGHNAFKDHDFAEAAKHKERMESVLSFNVDEGADADDSGDGELFSRIKSRLNLI